MDHPSPSTCRRPRFLRRRLAAGLRRAALSSIAVIVAAAASAQGLLRDAGMEHGLNRLAAPVLAAAGLPASGTRILVINDRSLNAFVVDSRYIFLHAGLILRLDDAAALQAVIAHEAAHIANGHFARRQLNASSARGTAGLGLALAIATGVATGNPAIASGVLMGSLGAAERGFLAHTRAEEASADQAALRYLALAGIGPDALGRAMAVIRRQEELTFGQVDPYTLAHPLTADRIRAIDDYTAALTDQTLPPPRGGDEAAFWFARSEAKLSAYFTDPDWTLDRLDAADRSVPAEIERAVAHFRNADLGAARTVLARLIRARPEDAYIHDLAGWIELDSGQPDRAAAHYARAAALAPREPLILAGLGRARLAQGDPAAAVAALEEARARDPFEARMLRDLALAYARTGAPGKASLATAERYALAGDLEDAGLHARRAADLLPYGSPGWSRAQDILHAEAQAEKRR